ncbi:MAG: beta-galactosidase, partial [Candidatus Eremiobacteraeota bacterium]|nr:beta-galactosidase [Candidatus Eremiobacteraeota bacterium]
MPSFRLGINYWPAQTAMAMWSRFDPSVLDGDFARIAGAGLESVRFFLLWETFQPHEDRIDAEACALLERFLDLLAAHGLRGMPTLFCGHMSGVNWLPQWTLDVATPHGRFRTISNGRISSYGIGDFYEAGPLLDAQIFAVRTLGARFRNHPTIEAWDLGNEFSNLREPRSPQHAAAWSKTLSDALAEASGHPVTGGIHGEDLEYDRRIRPGSICAPWGFATMHGYSGYSTFSRGGTDTEVVPFLYDLVS